VCIIIAVVEAEEEEEMSSVILNQSVNVSLNATIEMETNATESGDTDTDPVSIPDITTAVETFQEALFVSAITSYNSNDGI
jgi:hypothetical protein